MEQPSHSETCNFYSFSFKCLSEYSCRTTVTYPWLKRSNSERIKNKKINIYISKNSTKDFIYVNDVFDVLLKIIKRGKHRLYNVASGKNIKLSKILKEIKKITNCKINYTYNSNVVKEPKINIKRIINEFNFKTKNNLINFLNHLIINYKK